MKPHKIYCRGPVDVDRFNSCESPSPFRSDFSRWPSCLSWTHDIEMVLDLSSTLCWWSKSNNQPESCGGPTGKMGWAAVNSPHRSVFVNPAVISWETSESSCSEPFLRLSCRNPFRGKTIPLCSCIQLLAPHTQRLWPEPGMVRSYV